MSLADFQLEMTGVLPPAGDKAWSTWILDGRIVWVQNGYGPKQDGMRAIAAGFMTDWASIPRPFRVIWTPGGGPWRLAAVLHDWAYSTSSLTRRQADRLYLDACIAAGVRKRTRVLMWTALRVGGWLAWRSNRRNLAELGPRWRFLNAYDD